VTDHADLELIAAFHEGLLDGSAAERLGRHLTECGMCAERDAAIAQVTTRLAAAPIPAMPPELARRLDAALDAEIAAARAADGRTAARVAGGARAGRDRPPQADHGSTRPATRGAHERASRTPSTRGRARRPRGWMATALKPVAAVAAVFLIAGGGYLLIHSSQPTSSRSPSAASGQASRSPSAASPGRQRAAPMNPSIAAAGYEVNSGTSYQAGTLVTQASATFRRYANARFSPSKTGETIVPSSANTSLSGCLRAIAPGQLGLIVDNASYEGHRALVIIAPRTPTRAGHVWVVSPGCSASGHTVITTSTLP
jgi:hypothetical protein